MLVSVFDYMHHPHHPSMGMFNPTGGGGTWGAVCGAFWGPGDQRVEIWPVAVVWAPKALFGVLGSEPLAI